MVFNAIFNDISVTSQRSVLLVEETGVPPTLCKSLTNCITKCCNEYTSPERDSNSQHQWWRALIAKVVINPTIIRPRRPLLYVYNVSWKKSNSKQFSRIVYLFYHTNCGLSKFMIVCIYESCLPFFGGLESSYNCILMYLKFVLDGKLKNMHVFNAK